MTTQVALHSDLPIPPGEYLAEVLAEYGMSQADLAQRMERPPQAINEIVQGRKAITHETALQLAGVLGVPAEIWLGLETEYRLTRARRTEEAGLDSEVGLLAEIPYAAMAKYGWVPQARQAREKVRNVRQFFGVSSLAAVPGVRAYECAFRRAAGSASQYALAAWLRRGEIEARGIEAAPFDKARLRAALPTLRGLTRAAPERFVPEVTARLAPCGVAFVILPHLPKTYAHGAVFWLGERAVLQLSIRGSYADIFWFSLFHELGHLLRHGKRTILEGQDEEDDDFRRMEGEADEFAGNALIPAGAYAQFLRNGVLTKEGLSAFAEEQGVAVGIVVGRLQREGRLTYQQHHGLRERFKWVEE